MDIWLSVDEQNTIPQAEQQQKTDNSSDAHKTNELTATVHHT